LKKRINHFKTMQCPAGCVICRALFFYFLSPFIKPLLYVEKLQIGTVLPVVPDLYREFSEILACFDLCAIQSAQKQLHMLCNFHENTLGLLIFYTDYAII